MGINPASTPAGHLQVLPCIYGTIECVVRVGVMHVCDDSCCEMTSACVILPCCCFALDCSTHHAISCVLRCSPGSSSKGRAHVREFTLDIMLHDVYCLVSLGSTGVVDNICRFPPRAVVIANVLLAELL